jgi:glycine dehydrogenase subunit 1
MGEDGYRTLSKNNYVLSHYAKEQIEKISDIKIRYSGVFYNEFILQFKPGDVRQKVYASLKKEGFLPGLRIGDNSMLVTVTEMQTKQSIDSYVDALRRYVS